MNNIWHGIQPARITPKDFIGVIEISKGSKMKYELDKETGLLMLDRVLYNLTLVKVYTNHNQKHYISAPAWFLYTLARFPYTPARFLKGGCKFSC